MSEPSFTVDGNRLTLLTEGATRWAALIATVEGARTSLRALYYIYADDAAGRAFGDALIAAAGRGVRVTLIVDGFGSEEAERHVAFARLREAGITVCVFSPRLGRRYLLRNHQKLLLADGETGRARIMIGGFNIEEDYFGKPEDAAWRDLGLVVEGAAAGRMSPYFDALHEWVMRPKGKLRHLNHALTRYSETDGPLRWLIGGPTRRLSPWARTVRTDMRRASRIDVIAGYFTPSPTMLRRLDRAGRRDAGVRIVTAAKSDNNATVAAARFTYAGLLRKGVRIFEYAATKLHTKLYVIDSAVHVGSANFDMRSLFINLELMLRIEDAAFADHVRAYIEGEIADSGEVTAALYKARTGWWQRLRQFGAYLLIAVLDPGVSRGLNFGIDE
ncbi:MULTISPECIES: phosphatidylserine/phosphatidylglycerophosphate/cardiolipin synthase family protein [unclassified Sphingomonas]|uniref:phospholipase D-like domain-containing protein n=1 Tax=unclassified Sphingomonas TaxID=196159 RepID=UPI00226AE94F|nr:MULTISPECIES: phosphatidylserine/phosphatidylglycerophosphate/cardiolipin synthase family protein [unclassified Sphingomonas]